MDSFSGKPDEMIKGRITSFTRGGSRISGKGLNMYKGVSGVALLIIKYLMQMK